MNTTYLICYDIRDPRRLVRLHRMLKSEGLAVQYSVFGARLTKQRLDHLVRRILVQIDVREDDVRLYEAPRNCEVDLAGKSPQSTRHVLFHSELAPFLRKTLTGGTAEHNQ